MHHPQTTHLSDITPEGALDIDDAPTLDECIYEYDDTKVSVSFVSVAFSYSLALGRDLSTFWVVDSAGSIN
jgi:hypothetical protein